MEGFFYFIILMISLVAFFGLFQWILVKFFGVHTHGKFQAGKALEDRNKYKEAIDRYSLENPLLIEKAVKNCKNKKYKLTHYNVLSEIVKIEKEIKNKNLDEKNSVERNKESQNDIFSTEPNHTKMSAKLATSIESESSASYHQMKESEIDSISSKIQQQEIMEAISIINSLFYEFKNKIPILSNYEFNDIHKLIIFNKNTISLIKSYNSLFKLYTEGILSQDEFEEKKKQILYKSLNIERHGNI